ncbi:HesB/IscA family protein [Alkalimarinus coralli]|uniref:HesB/IscA family protein n=1 Tax=Alkalimarinus coralli TaxID=2935863 RepID=UPI00202AEA14|nr:iron-sulfur cluster assembly accessory protein [Alkalimarinus coralli]
MSTEQYTPDVNITMTESAIKHIRKEIAKKPDCQGIRLRLETSGCSGYMYETSLVSKEEALEQQDNDQIFTPSDDVKLFVSKKHLPILNGTEIDFVTQGLNSVLHFNNPNATAECGCGESFTVV